MNNNTLTKTLKLVLGICGAGLLLFTGYFVTTGFDELWNGRTLWLFGAGIAGLLLSLGLAAIIIALRKSSRAPRLLLFTTLLSFLVMLAGILQF